MWITVLTKHAKEQNNWLESIECRQHQGKTHNIIVVTMCGSPGRYDICSHVWLCLVGSQRSVSTAANKVRLLLNIMTGVDTVNLLLTLPDTRLWHMLTWTASGALMFFLGCFYVIWMGGLSTVSGVIGHVERAAIIWPLVAKVDPGRWPSKGLWPSLIK